jgi:type VI secretion system secreted protein Hcp
MDASRSDIFLRVQTRRAGKIKGEASTEGHEGEIEVRSWDWGVSASSAIGALGPAERRSYKQLVVLKKIDSASTGLLNALVGNDEVKEAVLAMRKAGGEALDYFTMTLGGARIVSVDIDVDDSGEPTERVSLAFTKIEIEYQRQESSGQSGGAFSFSDELVAAG